MGRGVVSWTGGGGMIPSGDGGEMTGRGLGSGKGGCGVVVGTGGGRVRSTKGWRSLPVDDDVAEGQENVHVTLGLRVCFCVVTWDGDEIIGSSIRRCFVLETWELIGENDESGGEEELHDERVAT